MGIVKKPRGQPHLSWCADLTLQYAVITQEEEVRHVLPSDLFRGYIGPVVGHTVADAAHSAFSLALSMVLERGLSEWRSFYYCVLTSLHPLV